MTATITDTQGIVAIAAAALAVVALLGVRGAGDVACAGWALRSGSCSGSSDERDLVAHAAEHAGRVRGAAGDTSGTSRQRLDGRLAGVETALHGAIAHRALVRYDAYNELSGQPVDVDRAARRRAARGSC